MKQMITEMKMKFENTSSNNKNRKPDYLDFDGDGNESESMVDALADKTESANSNIDEESGTGGIAGYQTPRAFTKNENSKKKIKYPGVAEAMELRLEKLIEGYREYATSNPKMSAETKVNETIIEVSRKLREIEESVRNASRLKEESGVTREGYKKTTNKALGTISERLVKISERVRNLMQ